MSAPPTRKGGQRAGAGRPTQFSERKSRLSITLSADARQFIAAYRDTHDLRNTSLAVEHITRTHPLAAVHGLSEPTE